MKEMITFWFVMFDFVPPFGLFVFFVFLKQEAKSEGYDRLRVSFILVGNIILEA